MIRFFHSASKQTQEPGPDRQHQSIVINKNRCPENHPCPSIRVCAVHALQQRGYAAPTVNQSTCTKCGKCVRYCPMGAISLR